MAGLPCAPSRVLALIPSPPLLRVFGRLAVRHTLDPQLAWSFAVTVVVTLIAKGAAFIPGYAIDDYLRLHAQGAWIASFVTRGRVGSAVVSWALYGLGADRQDAAFLFVAFGIVAMALFAALVVRFWGGSERTWVAVVAAIFIANHPFTVEIFTFRLAIGTVSASTLLVGVALWILLQQPLAPRRLAAASLVLTGALSLYQTALNYALMVGFVGLLVATARSARGPVDGRPGESGGELLRRSGALLLSSLASIGLFAALTWCVYVFSGAGLGERSRLLPISRAPQRAAEALDLMRTRAWSPDPLVPGVAQVGLLMVLAVAVAALAWRVSRSTSKVRLAAAAVLTMSLAAVWSVGLIVALDEWWPAPRVLAHVGVFWGGVLLTAHSSSSGWVRRALAPLALMLALSFVGTNTRVLNQQRRLNLRDMAKANRLVARLEALPGYRNILSVVVNGSHYDYPATFSTVDHDLNISAFGAAWAQVPLLNEVSGNNWLSAGADPDAARSAARSAAAYCGRVAPWPGPEAVTIEEHLAIICLASPPTTRADDVETLPAKGVVSPAERSDPPGRR